MDLRIWGIIETARYIVLVFIDESGDTGLKVVAGSSRYFVISLVIFEDHEETIACDRQIEELKSD